MLSLFNIIWTCFGYFSDCFQLYSISIWLAKNVDIKYIYAKLTFAQNINTANNFIEDVCIKDAITEGT